MVEDEIITIRCYDLHKGPCNSKEECTAIIEQYRLAADLAEIEYELKDSIMLEQAPEIRMLQSEARILNIL